MKKAATLATILTAAAMGLTATAAQAAMPVGPPEGGPWTDTTTAASAAQADKYITRDQVDATKGSADLAVLSMVFSKDGNVITPVPPVPVASIQACFDLANTHRGGHYSTTTASCMKKGEVIKVIKCTPQHNSACEVFRPK